MADILQKIKVIADTAAATRNLKDVKSLSDKIPKLLKVATLNYNTALTNLKTNFIALTAVATATFAVLYKGFVGIGEDVKSVNQMNTAILTMGISANVSAKSLFSYFETLLTGIGLSASALGTMAQGFISAGATTELQIKQLTQAAVGLAERIGTSSELAAGKLQKAMLGNTKGLKLFGISAKEGQTAQDLLNEALRQGAIAFNNIDPNSPARAIARMKLSFDNMIKGLASSFVPILTPVFNFITNNMQAIGRMLTTGAIAVGLKSTLNTFYKINAAIAAQITLLLQTNTKKIAALRLGIAGLLKLWRANGKLQLAGWDSMQKMNEEIAKLNIKLSTTQKIALSLKTIFSTTNLIILGISLAISFGPKLIDMFDKSAIAAKKLLQEVKNMNTTLLASTAGNERLKQQNETLKNSILIQKQLAGKIKLTKDLHEQLKNSYSNINTALNITSQATDTYKISQQNLNLATIQSINNLNTLRQSLLATANLKLRIALKLATAKLLNLPGTKLSRSEFAFGVTPRANVIKSTGDRRRSLLSAYSTALKSGNYALARSIAYELANIAGTMGRGNVANGYLEAIDQLTLLLLNRLLLKLSSLNISAPEYTNTAKDIAKPIKEMESMKFPTGKLKEFKYPWEINLLPVMKFTPPVVNVDDVFNLSALQDISDEIDPLIERFVMLKDANPFKEMPVAMFDELGSAMGSFISTFSNGLGAVLTQGANFSKQMKYIWRDLANNIISLLTRILVKMLAVFAIKTILNLIMPGSGNAAGIATSALGSMPIPVAAAGNAPTITNTVGTSISYMGRNPITDKLDEVIEAINNFTPVQTQVIDLPTLSSANRIGSAMTLRMS